MRNNYSKIFVYIIIFILYALFLRNDLYNVASLSLFRNETTVSNSIQIFLLTLSTLIYAFTNRKYIVNKDIKSFKRFIIIICIFSIISSIVYPIGARIIYLLMFLPLLILFFTYISTSTIPERILNISFFILFIYLVYAYSQDYARILTFGLIEDVATNASYFILYLLPLILAMNKNWLSIIAIIITAVVVISSSKRGGTIALGLGFISFFITKFVLIKERKLNFSLLLGLCIISILIIYGGSYLQESVIFERLENIQDDEGSGRIEIYQNVTPLIYNSAPIPLIFGHGWNAVSRDMGVSAHNDFLEVLYDFGIISFILYLMCYYKLYKYLVSLIKRKSELAPALSCLLCFLIVGSSVSHIVIYPGYFSIFMLILGYIYGKERINNKSISK